MPSCLRGSQSDAQQSKTEMWGKPGQEMDQVRCSPPTASWPGLEAARWAGGPGLSDAEGALSLCRNQVTSGMQPRLLIPSN